MKILLDHRFWVIDLRPGVEKLLYFLNYPIFWVIDLLPGVEKLLYFLNYPLFRSKSLPLCVSFIGISPIKLYSSWYTYWMELQDCDKYGDTDEDVQQSLRQ